MGAATVVTLIGVAIIVAAFMTGLGSGTRLLTNTEQTTTTTTVPTARPPASPPTAPRPLALTG